MPRAVKAPHTAELRPSKGVYPHLPMGCGQPFEIVWVSGENVTAAGFDGVRDHQGIDGCGGAGGSEESPGRPTVGLPCFGD